MSTARKAPAFQFYADDFLSGTMTFSHEQRGLYITLLCLQWSQGSVRVEDARELAGRMNPERLARVLAKFVDDGQGNLKNPRLERERTKQNEFRDAKSEAGRLGNAKRWHTHRTATTAASHSDGGEVADSIADSIANGRFPSPSPSPYKTEGNTPGEFGATAPGFDGVPNDLSNHPETEAEVIEHFRKLGAPYTAEQIHAAWLGFMANALDDGRTWMWGKRPVTDWRAAFESRLSAQKKEAAGRGQVGPGSMATENAAGTTAQAVVRVVGKD